MRMFRPLPSTAFGIFLALIGIQLVAQGTDLIIGNWELNVAKSKSTTPQVKSESRSYVMAGADIKASTKGIDADGKPFASQWTIRYDGSDQIVAGNPEFDSVSFKRIDAYKTEFTQKKAGKIVSTGTRSFSKDGKIMTIASKGTDSTGKPFDDVSVYDKR